MCQDIVNKLCHNIAYTSSLRQAYITLGKPVYPLPWREGARGRGHNITTLTLSLSLQGRGDPAKQTTIINDVLAFTVH